MNILSLFANIGVAEAYLTDIGFNVVLANEIDKRRSDLYQNIYPSTHMICGDITCNDIFNTIIEEAKIKNIDIIMATPPCQGMSTAGQQNKNDERNKLVLIVINAVKLLKPKYVFIENVPLFLTTEIDYNGQKEKIENILDIELSYDYFISKNVVDTKNYSVPQMRQRSIILLTRKDQKRLWTLPEQDKKIITMKDVIGNLPKIDPYIVDVTDEELIKIFPLYYERKEAALKISKWNNPPKHIKRQVISMMYTPSGKTAFDNKLFFPRKQNGEPAKGYHNTYKRQNWDTPAYTVTMDNRKISSQNNVHPGRKDGVDIEGNQLYSDARTLTLFEIMRVMTLPDDWNIPEDTSEAFIRRIIGEGVPPLFTKKVFQNLKEAKLSD